MKNTVKLEYHFDTGALDAIHFVRGVNGASYRIKELLAIGGGDLRRGITRVEQKYMSERPTRRNAVPRKKPFALYLSKRGL